MRDIVRWAWYCLSLGLLAEGLSYEATAYPLKLGAWGFLAYLVAVSYRKPAEPADTEKG